MAGEVKAATNKAGITPIVAPMKGITAVKVAIRARTKA
jgi:hypothetical protein